MANNSMRQITILYGNATDDIKFNITTNLSSNNQLDTINNSKTEQGEIFVYNKQYAGKKINFYVVPESAYKISSVDIDGNTLQAIEDIEVLENGEKNPKYDVNAKYKKLTYTYDMPANDIVINVVFEEKTKYELNLPENNEAALIKFGDYFKFNRYSKYNASLISETQNPETEEVESKTIDFTYELSGSSQEVNGTTYYAITNINSDEDLPLLDTQEYYVEFNNNDHYINTLRFDKENIFVKAQKESDDIYTFTSYAEETCDNKYSDGKVYYTGINTIVDGESYFEVEVIENDADDSFVGKLFYINIKSISNLSSTKAYELYSAQMNNEFKLDNINKTPIMIYEGDNVDLTITPIFNKTYVEVLSDIENLTISKVSDTYSFIMPSSNVNISLNTYINELHTVSLDNVENANIKIKNAYPMYNFTCYNGEDESDNYSGECRRLNNIIYQDGKAYEEIEILHSSNEETDVYLESHYVLADIFEDNYEGETKVDSYTYDDRINKLVPTIITMYKENQDMPDGVEEYKATIKFELGDKKEEIKYYGGETVKFDTITPDKGYNIKDISINYTKTTDDDEEEISEKINNYFTMPNADVIVKANVIKKSTTYNILYGNWDNAPKSYSISVDEIVGADIDIATTGINGNTIKFTLNKQYGYDIDNVLINDGEVEVNEISSDIASKTYEFIMPDSEVNIKVNTRELPKYAFTYDQPEHATINSDLQQEYCEGDYITLNITPEENYKVTEVAYNGNVVEGNDNNEYSFQMPAEEVNITITTKELHQIIITTKVNDQEIDGFENITVTGNYDERHIEGDEVTITVETLNHYQFINFTNGNEVIETNEYSFNMPDNDVNVIINIKEEDKFGIIVDENINIDVTINPNPQYKNETVTLEFDIPETKLLDSIKVVNEETEEEIEVINNSFVMPEGNVIIKEINLKPVPSYYICDELPENLDDVEFTKINTAVDNIDVIYDHLNNTPIYVILTNEYEVIEMHDKDNSEIQVGYENYIDNNYTLYYSGNNDDPANIFADTEYRITITKKQ